MTALAPALPTEIQERRLVRIPVYGASLTAEMTIPAEPRALVVFPAIAGVAHAYVRREMIAEVQDSGFATLVFDLLSPEEEMLDAATHTYRFDMRFLSHRLGEILDWAATQTPIEGLKVILYAAGTGVDAAVGAATARPDVALGVISSQTPDTIDGLCLLLDER